MIKPKAIICDLDGTLCDIRHRLHFINGKKKDWKSFQRNCFGDGLNEWCKDILVAMKAQKCEIILFSGRMDFVRNETEEWLERNGIEYLTLKMRKSGDYREDYIVKKEMLNDYQNRFNILFAIDDRQQVVDMWRENGIVCLQCQKGDY
jgi:FMN phosphatase YigB (HAD superfamily)